MKTDAATMRAWSPRAHEEIPELRRAITAQLGEPMIATEMAPMMGDLLTRLEGFSVPPRVDALRGPELPVGEARITQADAVAALHNAMGVVRERVISGGESPQNAQALQAMVKVIEDHLTMKGEILARCASTSPRG